MKIEDLFYPMPKRPVDADHFDLEKWRRETPMDYLKAAYLINMATNKDMVFSALYRVIRLYIPDTLYKYFSLTDNEELNEQKFHTLSQNKIYMSAIKDFNDPFDTKAFFYRSDILKKIERLAPYDGKLIDDFSSYLRAASFTSNGVNSMPMWAHYANNHRGFCISYDMKINTVLSSCTFPVQYTNQRLDITSFMDGYAKKFISAIDAQSKAGRKQIKYNDISLIYLALLLCNIKHTSWSYENEFRCTTGSTAPGMPYIDAKAKEIFVGLNCSAEHQKQLTKVANSLHIPIHRMIFEENSSSFELVEEA